jgi:hypothetical protein
MRPTTPINGPSTPPANHAVSCALCAVGVSSEGATVLESQSVHPATTEAFLTAPQQILRVINQKVIVRRTCAVSRKPIRIERARPGLPVRASARTVNDVRFKVLAISPRRVRPQQNERTRRAAACPARRVFPFPVLDNGPARQQKPAAKRLGTQQGEADPRHRATGQY